MDGFFKTDIPDMGREENRAFVLETNEKLGVSRAQAEAMLAGSMFVTRLPQPGR